MSSLKKLEKCLYCGQLGRREDTATGTDFNHQFKGGELYQNTVNFCSIPKAIVKGLETKLPETNRIDEVVKLKVEATA